MQKFNTFRGLAVPLDRANVDTDQILPKQFLTRVERSGWGQFAFYNWRYQPDGAPEPSFVLNQPRYHGVSVLLARENFGCGSSREHAPWALADFGLRVIIAPSYAVIFRNNCFQNGMLPIELENQMLDEWFRRVEAQPGYGITVNLKDQTLTGDDGFACTFGVDPFRKHCLLEGLDDIGLTLEHQAAIEAYEQSHDRPWQAAVAGASRKG